jgi:hypothetical protein
VARRKPGRSKPPSEPESLMAFYLRNRTNIEADQDKDIARSCASKQPYKSEGEARAIAAMNGMKLSTYECTYCGFWHLTRRPTSARPNIVDD